MQLNLFQEHSIIHQQKNNMGLLRLIIWGLFFYFIIKMVKSVTASLLGNKNKDKVENSKGKQKPPLDLRNQDVEDADFEDIK